MQLHRTAVATIIARLCDITFHSRAAILNPSPSTRNGGDEDDGGDDNNSISDMKISRAVLQCVIISTNNCVPVYSSTYLSHPCIVIFLLFLCTHLKPNRRLAASVCECVCDAVNNTTKSIRRYDYYERGRPSLVWWLLYVSSHVGGRLTGTQSSQRKHGAAEK